MACGKFGNDVLDNVPLSRTGVLRLVDQDMVEAAVKLVMYPARRDLVQHRQRLVDQIVIIEQAALLLFAPVVCCRRHCDMQQGCGAVARNHGAASFDQGRKTQHLRLEQAGDRRIVADECLGQDGRTRRLVVGEKDAEIFVDLSAAGKPQGSAQLLCLVLVRLAAAVECGRDFQPAPAREIRAIDDFALDVFEAVVVAYAKHGRHLGRRGLRAAGGVGPGHEMVAAQASLANDVLERNISGVRHRGLECAAEHAVGRVRGFQKYPEVGALHHVGLVALVEHRKTRRHVGLERELLQKPCTQRVNGLHLQSARRFQRPRKQFARDLAQLSVGVGDAGVADRVVECGIVECHPVTKRREYALRHVGGRRLGEGDAEDFFRRHAGEQQPDHALHQHVRLAGAGIGRDERGRGRVRGAGLLVADRAGDGAHGFHHSGSPKPPAADHSLIRARSS